MNNIDIIHLLEDNSICIETEVNNILSGKEINIVIRKILLNHQAYISIISQIDNSFDNPEDSSALLAVKRSYEVSALKVLGSIRDLKNLNINVEGMLSLYNEGAFLKLNDLICIEELLLTQSKLISISEIKKNRDG